MQPDAHLSQSENHVVNLSAWSKSQNLLNKKLHCDSHCCLKGMKLAALLHQLVEPVHLDLVSAFCSLSPSVQPCRNTYKCHWKHHQTCLFLCCHLCPFLSYLSAQTSLYLCKGFVCLFLLNPCLCHISLLTYPCSSLKSDQSPSDLNQSLLNNWSQLPTQHEYGLLKTKNLQSHSSKPWHALLHSQLLRSFANEDVVGYSLAKLSKGLKPSNHLAKKQLNCAGTRP